MVKRVDFLVLGSGIAGLSAAIEASHAGNVLILSKDKAEESNTEYAQGGIAAALSDEDKVSFHFRDTLKAGDGLCDPDAVHILVGEGPGFVMRMIQWGTKFDQEKTKLMFTREAAHSRKRVLHAGGDSTGKEIVRALVAKAKTLESITLKPFWFAADLIIDDGGRVIGATYIDEKSGEHGIILASAVILATGGAGRVYSNTTNPDLATGDGIAAAALIGAELQDMEFVQFHPTVLKHEGAPRFLLTEAIRGEGGLLRNIDGKRFMDEYDPREELAPRDVVSRAIIKEMKKTGAASVFLDLTEITEVDVSERFPQVYQNCMVHNLDLKKDMIPVSPAAHYFIGGVRSDIHGCTSLEGLFTAGEVSCTGVHGANRLASNSLLEGLVFGIRAGRSAVDYVLLERLPEDKKIDVKTKPVSERSPEWISSMKQKVQSLMWENVGIMRTPEAMNEALTFFKDNYEEFSNLYGSRELIELRNIFICGLFTTYSALRRKESRGTHYREDFPEKLKKREHSIVKIDDIIKN